MTDATRKRAERARRKAAGYKRVECWLDESLLASLDWYCKHTGKTRDSVIFSAIQEYVA